MNEELKNELEAAEKRHVRLQGDVGRGKDSQEKRVEPRKGEVTVIAGVVQSRMAF